MFVNSIKGINRLISKGMTNIYLKVLIEEIDVLRTYVFEVQKFCLQVRFWRAQTHSYFTELENLLLQLKSQRSGSKTLRCFKIRQYMQFVNRKNKL